MRQTSVRKDDHDLNRLDRSERIAVLRAKMASMVVNESQVSARKILREQDFLSVPQELADILPEGGFVRGQLVEMADNATFIAQLIAHTSGNNGYVAVVGWPTLSLAGIPDSGGNLNRIVVIPQPEEQALNVMTMLAEGMDLIIYRHTGQQLSLTHTRQLLAKLRSTRAVVLAVGLAVPSQVTRIAATISGFRGIGSGSGRIRSVDFTLRAQVKGRRYHGRMTIGRKRDLAVV